MDGNNREALVGRIAVLEEGEGEDGLISKKVVGLTETVKVFKEEEAVDMKDSKVDIRTTLGTIKEITKGRVVVEVRLM